MTDTLTRAQRSARMSLIRSHDSKFELRIRSAVHCLGYRFRKHYDRLPGKPDLVFVSRRKVIFLHGCFWHGHECPMNRRPQTNISYWERKVERNRTRDVEVRRRLRRRGWRVLTIWECQSRDLDRAIQRIQCFLVTEESGGTFGRRKSKETASNLGARARQNELRHAAILASSNA